MLITIGHTYGSGGLEIGRRLAARLEIPCGDAEADEGAVRSLAGRGSCVVVGLCADHVLSGQPGLNRIFIHCGMEQRVERLMRERGLSPAEAAREALRQDRERARLYGLHTGAKWGEVGRYDLTVDSGPLGVSGTCLLYTSPRPRDGATSRMPSSA